MSPNIKEHWAAKNSWERVESIGTICLGALAFIALAAWFGQKAGATVQLPGDKLESIQSAVQAEHSALIAIDAKEQAHADAIGSLQQSKEAAKATSNSLASVLPIIQALQESQKRSEAVSVNTNQLLQKLSDGLAEMKEDVSSLKTGQQYLRENQKRVMDTLDVMRVKS